MALRAVLVVDSVVFLVAAMLNAGVHIPLGFATLRIAYHVGILVVLLFVAGMLIVSRPRVERQRSSR